MNYQSEVFVIAWAIAMLLGSASVAAQVSVDLENRYSNVGAIMVWRVDSFRNAPAVTRLRKWHTDS